jgi:transcriptional regulator with XRE-family HTH domain
VVLAGIRSCIKFPIKLQLALKIVNSKIWGNFSVVTKEGVMNVAKKKMRGVPMLGERINRFMATANLNASELSARSGISTSYLSRILNGEVANPTIDFVTRIAAALGVTETKLVRDANVKGFTPAVAGAPGSGVGLIAMINSSRTGQPETASQQRDQIIKLLVAQILVEGQLTLTPEKRMLAERLISEIACSVCEVVAKELDQQRK